MFFHISSILPLVVILSADSNPRFFLPAGNAMSVSMGFSHARINRLKSISSLKKSDFGLVWLGKCL
jgi:hypothetical protein